MDEEKFVIKPFISIIIPTYNRVGFLKYALESIWAQEYQPLEIIVVDDGSTDATPEFITERGERVVYIRQENQGVSAARNRGLENARGDVIGFLDSDDLWPPDKLNLQLPYLFPPHNFDYVMGYTRFIRLPGGRPILSIHQKPDATPNLGAGLYKKICFETIGNFDPTMQQSEDLDWYQRARSTGLTYTTIPEVTLIYQLHEGNLTNNRAEARLGTLKMLRKRIERNRNG